MLKECVHTRTSEHARAVCSLLRSLTCTTKNCLSRIKFQMELFNLHIQQGRDLCAKLSSVASVIKTPPAQLQSQLAIEVHAGPRSRPWTNPCTRLQLST